jgi:hypothetical protein
LANGLGVFRSNIFVVPVCFCAIAPDLCKFGTSLPRVADFPPQEKSLTGEERTNRIFAKPKKKQEDISPWFI